MPALSFYGIFPIWKKLFKNTCHKILAFISFALLQSSRFNLHVYFWLFCQTPTFEMPSLNQNGKVTCDDFGTQTKKPILARHKKRRSAGTLYCTQCRNFSYISQADLNFHTAKKHSAPKPDSAIKCKFCYEAFLGFLALRQQKNSQHGCQIKTTNAVANDIINEGDDAGLKEELQSRQLFLVDSEHEKAR